MRVGWGEGIIIVGGVSVGASWEKPVPAERDGRAARHYHTKGDRDTCFVRRWLSAESVDNIDLNERLPSLLLFYDPSGPYGVL